MNFRIIALNGIYPYPPYIGILDFLFLESMTIAVETVVMLIFLDSFCKKLAQKWDIISVVILGNLITAFLGFLIWDNIGLI